MKFDSRTIFLWVLWSLTAWIALSFAFVAVAIFIWHVASSPDHPNPHTSLNWRSFNDYSRIVFFKIIPACAPIIGAAATHLGWGRRSPLKTDVASSNERRQKSDSPVTQVKKTKRTTLEIVAAVLMINAATVPAAGFMVLSALSIIAGPFPDTLGPLLIGFGIVIVGMLYAFGYAGMRALFSITILGILYGPAFYSTGYIIFSIPAALCLFLDKNSSARRAE